MFVYIVYVVYDYRTVYYNSGNIGGSINNINGTDELEELINTEGNAATNTNLNI